MLPRASFSFVFFPSLFISHSAYDALFFTARSFTPTRPLPGGDLRFASAPCCAVAVFKPRSCASRAAPPSRCAPLRPSFLVAPQSLLCWPLDSADVSFLLVCSVLSLLTLPHRPSASSRRVHPRVMRVCSHPARVFPSLPMSCALPVHCSVAIIVLHAAARPLLTAHVSFLSFHPCARVFAAAHSSHVRSFLPSSALPSLPVAASLAFSSTPFLRPARRISYSCPRDRLLLRRFLRFISARPRRAPRQATRSFPRFTRRCGVFFLSVIFFSAPWRPYQRRIAYCHRRGCPYPPRRPTIPWLPSRPAPSGLSTASPCFSSLTSAVPASRYCAGPRALCPLPPPRSLAVVLSGSSGPPAPPRQARLLTQWGIMRHPRARLPGACLVFSTTESAVRRHLMVRRSLSTTRRFYTSTGSLLRLLLHPVPCVFTVPANAAALLSVRRSQ